MARIILPLSPEAVEQLRILGDGINLHGKVDAIKLLTDNLPANTATTLSGISTDIAAVQTTANAIEVDTNAIQVNQTTIEGKIDTMDLVVDGIQTDLGNPLDGLGAIKTAVDANQTDLTTIESIVSGINNSTRFTVAVPTLMEVPTAGTAYYRIMTSLFDGAGNPTDTDLDELFYRVVDTSGTTLSGVYFSDNAGTAITANSTVGHTFIGWYKMNTAPIGRAEAFIGIASTATKQGLTVEFGYKEATVDTRHFRATNVVDYESTAVTAGAVWDELLTAHIAAGTFGKATQDLIAEIGTASDLGSGASVGANLADIAGATFVTATDSNEAISNAVSAVDAKVVTVDSNVTAIQTDLNNGIDGLGAIKTAVDANQLDLTNIEADTQNIQISIGTMTNLGSGADIANNLADINTAIGNQANYATVFSASKTTAAIALTSETLVLSTAEGIDGNNNILQQLKVTSSVAVADYDVKIFEKVGNPAANLALEVQEIDASGLNLGALSLVLINADITPTNNIYVQVINNTATSATFTVTLRGERAAN